MSALVFDKDVSDYPLSFSEYLLTEGIKPKETSYGTDEYCKNGVIDTIYKKQFCSTLIKNEDEYIFVGILSDGECSFGTVKEQYYNKDLLEMSSYISDKKKNNGSPAIKIFGKVFYVLLKIFKKYNLKTLKFEAANKDLGNVYSKMVKNKYFLKSLEDEDLYYNGLQDGYFTFVKNASFFK